MPTLTEIRAELDADPKALGYAALRTQTNAPEALANRLNERGASAETINVSYVPLEDAIAEIRQADYTALSAAGKQAVDQYFRGTSIKTANANMRAVLGVLFPAGSETRTALLALASRSASRAEALWGEHTAVTAIQTADALALAV